VAGGSEWVTVGRSATAVPPSWPPHCPVASASSARRHLPAQDKGRKKRAWPITDFTAICRAVTFDATLIENSIIDEQHQDL
jgi:hypothetical protein